MKYTERVGLERKTGARRFEPCSTPDSCETGHIETGGSGVLGEGRTVTTGRPGMMTPGQRIRHPGRFDAGKPWDGLTNLTQTREQRSLDLRFPPI